MEYSYIQLEDEIYQLRINCDSGLIGFNFDPNDESHATLIECFNDKNKLLKYIEYLCADKNRPFILDEILKLW